MLEEAESDSPSPSLSPVQTEVLHRMGESVGMAPENVFDDDALVGYFQSFRPDGRGLAGVFAGLDYGDEIHERLETLFESAGNDRRPGGGRDAYFIVRNPVAVDAQAVQDAGERWIEQMKRLAVQLGKPDAASQLDTIDRIRVLEGLPPKHPKAANERAELLDLLSDGIPNWLSAAIPDLVFADKLRSPFYYVNCDAMLRDYLMWPIYREHVAVEDPFEPYFCLWRHGVKWRVFQETQIDLYMPRF